MFNAKKSATTGKKRAQEGRRSLLASANMHESWEELSTEEQAAVSKQAKNLRTQIAKAAVRLGDSTKDEVPNASTPNHLHHSNTYLKQCLNDQIEAFHHMRSDKKTLKKAQKWYKQVFGNKTQDLEDMNEEAIDVYARKIAVFKSCDFKTMSPPTFDSDGNKISQTSHAQQRTIAEFMLLMRDASTIKPELATMCRYAAKECGMDIKVENNNLTIIMPQDILDSLSDTENYTMMDSHFAKRRHEEEEELSMLGIPAKKPKTNHSTDQGSAVQYKFKVADDAHWGPDDEEDVEPLPPCNSNIREECEQCWDNLKILNKHHVAGKLSHTDERLLREVLIKYELFLIRYPQLVQDFEIPGLHSVRMRRIEQLKAERKDIERILKSQKGSTVDRPRELRLVRIDNDIRRLEVPGGLELVQDDEDEDGDEDGDLSTRIRSNAHPESIDRESIKDHGAQEREKSRQTTLHPFPPISSTLGLQTCATISEDEAEKRTKVDHDYEDLEKNFVELCAHCDIYDRHKRQQTLNPDATKLREIFGKMEVFLRAYTWLQVYDGSTRDLGVGEKSPAEQLLFAEQQCSIAALMLGHIDSKHRMWSRYDQMAAYYKSSVDHLKSRYPELEQQDTANNTGSEQLQGDHPSAQPIETPSDIVEALSAAHSAGMHSRSPLVAHSEDQQACPLTPKDGHHTPGNYNIGAFDELGVSIPSATPRGAQGHNDTFRANNAPQTTFSAPPSLEAHESELQLETMEPANE